jgi:hypothetical protein
MKIIHLCVLGLVCLAAVRANTTETSTSHVGLSISDTHESTHQKTVGTFKNTEGEAYSEKTGDVAFEWTETDGEDTQIISTESDAPVTSIVDGKVVTVFKKTTSKVDVHRKFKKVKRFWSETEVVDSIASLLTKISAVIPKLSADDYTVFNAIATTDYGKYWSDYNYWEIKDADLAVALTNLASVYKSPITPEKITYLVSLIQACDDGAVVEEIPSDGININNKDGWKIYAQFFAATCSKTSEKNQIFAWAASKQGEYLPGQYSESNKETVALTIHTWLVSHLPLLVSCTNSPVQPMHIWGGSEDSVNEPYTETSS